MVKTPPAMQETQKIQVPSLSRDDPLEEGMATYCSILARRIPWTKELAGFSPQNCKESDTTEAT